ncbi:MAG: trypsin-like peptidase domain-containing protein [Elusimicrobia bacterium]|nr:trypsin-like peptidase domain-containing protein [Elusimicrobiota bacterium]
MKRVIGGLLAALLVPNFGSAATFEAVAGSAFAEFRQMQRPLVHRISAGQDDIIQRLNRAKAEAIAFADPGVVRIEVPVLRRPEGSGSPAQQRQQQLNQFMEYLMGKFGEEYLKNNPGRQLPNFSPDSGQPRGMGRSTGSGVIIGREADGSLLIATNAHVVELNEVGGEVEITTFDMESRSGKILGYNKSVDLALVKMNEPCTGCRVLELADASEDLQVGYLVFAMGAPFGFAKTTTSGMISMLKRTSIPGGPPAVQNYIQTDAPINRGNSGGPLINAATRKVVGINTAIFSPSGGSVGIAFTVPSAHVTELVERYRTRGVISASRLGAEIGFNPVRREIVLGRILPESAAKDAQLLPGDVVLKVIVGGNTLGNFASVQDFTKMIADMTPNEQITFRIRRGNQIRDVAVTLKEFK